MSQQSASKPMGIRRIQIARESDLPNDCAATPGGTIFGTTPGGSKIIYDRMYLLKVRDSPASHTPPSNLPVIPGVTCPRGEKAAAKAAEGGQGDGKVQDVAESTDANEIEMEL